MPRRNARRQAERRRHYRHVHRLAHSPHRVRRSCPPAVDVRAVAHGSRSLQIEIYEESKHGVLFQAQRHLLNLSVEPKKLTTRDMVVPTCATCHMSSFNGVNMTHDPSGRLNVRPTSPK